jgi:sugar/nucleoside kinase (ribokinase family)
MYEVACVGILCADVLAKPVDSLPEKGKLELVDKLQLQIGGCAANVAVDLSKIGIDTSIVGKIGDDGFGRFLLETLKNEKVDVLGLKVDRSVPTSASMVMIDSGGERSILHCLGSNGTFSYEDINFNVIKNSKILFIAGTFLMPEFDGTGAERLLKEAKQAGVLCCSDTAWDSTGQWMKKIEAMLKYLDWFMPSYDEANKLSEKSDPEEMAEVFLSKGAKNVLIKLGKDGCFVKPENHKGLFVPTYKDIKVVDTSGAGDSFCAGFVAGLSKGWDIEKCAKFANAVGAQCVMQIGTTTGIKSMSETLEFMKIYENL